MSSITQALNTLDNEQKNALTGADEPEYEDIIRAWAAQNDIDPDADNSWEECLYTLAFHGRQGWEGVQQILGHASQEEAMIAATPVLREKYPDFFDSISSQPQQPG
jgi:hypothetical protein